VTGMASRLRAAVGALGVLAFASPLAAQNHFHRGQMRAAAQWVGRTQGAVRQEMRWRRATGWRAPAVRWRRAYVAGYGWRGFAPRRAWGRPVMVARYARARRGFYRRPWMARMRWRYRAL